MYVNLLTQSIIRTEPNSDCWKYYCLFFPPSILIDRFRLFDTVIARI